MLAIILPLGNPGAWTHRITVANVLGCCRVRGCISKEIFYVFYVVSSVDISNTAVCVDRCINI